MKKITIIKVLLLVMTLSGLLIYFQSTTTKTPFHEDEYLWISRGAIFFDLAFLQRNFNNHQWREYISYDQAKLPEYIYGAFVYVVFHQSPIQTLNTVNFGVSGLRDDAWLTESGNHLDHLPIQLKEAGNIILLCRRLNVCIGLICLLLIFFIGYNLKGYFHGLVAILVLAINPLFQENIFIATADTVFLCCLLATFLATLHYLSKPTIKQILIVSILAGLTAAAKLHGLAVIYTLTFGLVGNYIAKRKWDNTFLHICIVPFVAFAVFVILNPFTWSKPLTNTSFMLNARYEQSMRFCISYPENCAPTFLQRLKNLNQDLIGPNNQYNSFYQIPFLDTGLLAIGLILLIRSAIRRKNYILWFLWWTISIATVILIMMFYRWSRYNIILLPWISLIESFTLSYFLPPKSRKNKRQWTEG